MSGRRPVPAARTRCSLLVDLSGQGDRLVGTGFDDAFTEIFPRTTIAGEASKNALKRLARQRIVNDGGTDYTVGLGAAFDALAADPLNPVTPKAAIFLTDGANNGTYENAHLRFAFNGTGRARLQRHRRAVADLRRPARHRLRRRGHRPPQADRPRDRRRLQRHARTTPSWRTSTSSAVAAPPARPRC